MHLQSLPADEPAVRRYVEALWLPYHRELEATVESHELADDVDLVAEEVPFRVDRLQADDYRLWVAVDGADEAVDLAAGDVDLAGSEGTLAGFVSAELTEAASVFDRPDRVHLCDVFVRDGYRGTGLASKLVERVADYARETGCGEVTLDVDVDNDRALAFYEKLGFDALRQTLTVGVDELDSEN